MSIWDTYDSRFMIKGGCVREAVQRRTFRTIHDKVVDSLSYEAVEIDGLAREAAILSSDDFASKTIISLPGEKLHHGGLVSWNHSFWLISECDVQDPVYAKGKMIRCNHLLKWVSVDGVIHEQWCRVEDGTEYKNGEYEDREFIVTRGDTRIAITIAKNKHTVLLNRESRFLIDDPDAEHKLAYQLTKPLKTGNVYGRNGVYRFILQEVMSTDDDCHELGIADYYKYYERENVTEEDSENHGTTTKEGWI